MHRAGCRLSPTLAVPPPVSTKPIARRCSLKKSVQIHANCRCGVAQASFDHLRWCRSSCLSMGRTRAWPVTSELYFRRFSRHFSCQNQETEDGWRFLNRLKSRPQRLKATRGSLARAQERAFFEMRSSKSIGIRPMPHHACAVCVRVCMPIKSEFHL